MSDNSDNISGYFGSHIDNQGHYRPSNNINNNIDLSVFQPNVYGYYSHANSKIPFNIKALPLTYFYDYPNPDVHHLEHSNRIIIPSTILGQIYTHNGIITPMTFEIDGANDYLGVYNFYDDIDVVYIPHRIFQKIIRSMGITKINAPIPITLKLHNIQLPTGTHATFRFHNSEFLDVSDHRGYLEMNLNKYYTVITEGTTIDLPAPKELECPEGTFFKVDIVSTKPEKTILITDTDLNIDFEEPLDYDKYLEKKEKEKQEKEIKEYQDLTGHGIDFWEKRDKESLRTTGYHALPFITNSQGKIIKAKLSFNFSAKPSKKSKQNDKITNVKILAAEKPKKEKEELFKGTGHTLRKKKKSEK